MKDINISLDLWGTLIKSTPTFKHEKFNLIKKYFSGCSLEEIAIAFEDTKRELNCIIESTGWQPTQEIIWKHLFSKLDGGHPLHHLDRMHIIDEYQFLFCKYPPEIYSYLTGEFLIKLNKIGNLHISSNTMFATGNSMKCSLPFNEKLFTMMHFSDEYPNVAKPHSSMFRSPYCQLHYHIGDNPRTDGWGAENAGVIPIIINSNDKTIEDAYNIIASRQGI